MSFFGRLLGSDKALDVVDKGIQGGINILDSAFYTDQEKAEHKAKIFDTWLKAQELIGKESSPTSLSRRIIAWSIISISAFAFVVGVLFVSFGEKERLDNLLGLIEAMSLNWAFTGVIGFYFLPHMFGRNKSIESGKK